MQNPFILVELLLVGNDLISVIVPAYNEESSISSVINRIKSCKFGIETEIIVIDNKSTDKTREIASKIEGVKVFSYADFQGRSASLNYGVGVAKGSVIAFQDADLEISPDNLPEMLNVLRDKSCEVVYGSRFLKVSNIIRVSYYANKILTFLANLVFGLRLTDLETGCIMIRSETLRSLKMQSKGWDFSIELAAKLAARKIKIVEVPVEYFPRTRKEGKKLSYSEGIRAVYHIFHYKFAGK